MLNTIKMARMATIDLGLNPFSFRANAEHNQDGTDGNDRLGLNPFSFRANAERLELDD